MNAGIENNDFAVCKLKITLHIILFFFHFCQMAEVDGSDVFVTRIVQDLSPRQHALLSQHEARRKPSGVALTVPPASPRPSSELRGNHHAAQLLTPHSRIALDEGFLKVTDLPSKNASSILRSSHSSSSSLSGAAQGEIDVDESFGAGRRDHRETDDPLHHASEPAPHHRQETKGSRDGARASARADDQSNDNNGTT